MPGVITTHVYISFVALHKSVLKAFKPHVQGHLASYAKFDVSQSVSQSVNQSVSQSVSQSKIRGTVPQSV